MRIVQSFWSKPFFSEKLHPVTNVAQGWVDKKNAYMSWTLSCLLLNRYYKEVDIFTDEAGCDLLIHKLELPYATVKVVLDDLNIYSPDLWALGKLYTYGMQTEPFIHVDSDVFIWEALPPSIINAELCAQHIENYEIYELALTQIKNSFEYIPEILTKSNKVAGRYSAINAGIIGGHRIDFFNEYVSIVFGFIEKNAGQIDSIDPGMINIVFEQFLFYELARNNCIVVEYLLGSPINEFFDGLADFTGVPERTKFIHTVGAFKKIAYINGQVEHRLQMDFPKHYYRILKLLQNCQL